MRHLFTPPASRSRLRWVIAVVLGASMLTGCSAESLPDGSDGTAKNVAGVADGTPVRTIEDVDGQQVIVPTEPQRIVTLSEPVLDGVLALDLMPVGTVPGRGTSEVPNYIKDKAEGIDLVGSVAEFNFEAIAALKPDLIMTYASGGNNPEAVEILEKIAPVYFVGYAGADWKTTFRNIANAVNKSDMAEQVLADFDSYAADVGERLQEAGYADKTFSIVRWQGKNASLILNDLPPGMALKALGLKRPPNQDKNGRGHPEPISMENLEEVDADYMFFGTLGGSSYDNPNAGGTADVEGAKEALKEAETVPGFTQFNAYQQGHIITVDGSLWTATGGPILMTRIVENIEAELL